jgi:transposase
MTEADSKTQAILEEIARTESSRYHQRLHGVLMVIRGMHCKDVAALLDKPASTVLRWVRKFERQGFVGLRGSARPGRAPRLMDGVLDRLQRELDREPRRLGYRQEQWSGTLLSHHLNVRYGLDLKARQCQRLLHQLGYRLRSASAQTERSNESAVS